MTTTSPRSPLFRAEPFSESLLNGAPQRQRDSIRLPSNVPYVVDNLWEFLRPSHMPSRRRAVYASPTRELARASCAGQDTGQGFCVFELVPSGAFKVAQLKVKDAKFHADVRKVLKLVQAHLSPLTTLEPAEQSSAAWLFMPGAQPAQWTRAGNNSAAAARFVAEATALSTFWQDATDMPGETEGELFLELGGHAWSARDMQGYR